MQSESDELVFESAPTFAGELGEQTSVRLLVEPDTPLRGTDSYDGHVVDLDDHMDGLRVTVASDQLFEGSLSGEYTRETIYLRFVVPATIEANEPIEVEKNVAGEFEAPDWKPSGYLVGGGVLQMFK